MLLTKNERDEIRNTKAFAESNKPWNDYNLNRTANIGAVMSLIKDSKATTFEEWESYYLQTGAQRAAKMKKWVGKEEFWKLAKNCGRTTDDLLEVAQEFSSKTNIPLEIAYNYVYIRVIDETWIGYERELNALNRIKELCKLYPNLTASGVDSFTDTEYAVDFEIRQKDTIVLGIQLKSTKYRDSKMKAVDEVKVINKAKNAKYTKKFGAEVLYLYVEDNKIVNWMEMVECLDDLFGMKPFN